MTIKQVFRRSVFHKTPPTYDMSDMIATLFHRLAATVYLLYSVWASVAMWYGLPAIESTTGSQWATIFAGIVLLTTAPAFIGATFFPALARLELYSGGAFATLILIYAGFSFKFAIFDGGSWTGPIVILSLAVLPVCRTLMILYFLLKQATTRQILEGK